MINIVGKYMEQGWWLTIAAMFAFIIMQIKHVMCEKQIILKQRPHQARGIWKHRLGLPSTLIRHENGAFRKRSSNRMNLKSFVFRFRLTKNVSFLKQCHRMWFCWPSFPQTEIQNDWWLLRFSILRRSVDRKPLMCFESQISPVVVGKGPKWANFNFLTY